MTAALDHAEAALVAALDTRGSTRAAILNALAAIRAARIEPEPSDILAMSEAVRISGRTPSTVRRWAAEHRLGRKLGGEWLLSRRAFMAFVESGSR